MGYFKFKERGFNLQQTADAIEQRKREQQLDQPHQGQQEVV
ncbi:hypothetical protein [Streptomyces sp. NBRC 110611]|nr:hypothetical protein [Streptomyces sp. NBRC 110611]